MIPNKTLAGRHECTHWFVNLGILVTSANRRSRNSTVLSRLLLLSASHATLSRCTQHRGCHAWYKRKSRYLFDQRAPHRSTVSYKSLADNFALTGIASTLTARRIASLSGWAVSSRKSTSCRMSNVLFLAFRSSKTHQPSIDRQDVNGERSRQSHLVETQFEQPLHHAHIIAPAE